MDLESINNFFGDIDLFLMDFLLKGGVSKEMKVLDVGCGEGRNGIYFIGNGFDYTGIDPDHSKIQLLKYFCDSLEQAQVKLMVTDLASFDTTTQFDLIICTQVLHFSDDKGSFLASIDKLKYLLIGGGILYLSMDSILDTTMGTDLGGGHSTFPDGKSRFVLDSTLHDELAGKLAIVEPTRTLIRHRERAQSFLFLKKT